MSAYSKFRNEFVISYEDEIMSSLYENIKKYKLASSEGINKATNRTIRFEILYKLCVEGDKQVFEALEKMTEDMGQRLEGKKDKKDLLEMDDVVDEDE